MALKKRKDNHNRVLKDGEYQRVNGTYEYKWTDKAGKRHSIYSKSLDELREKELDVLKNVLDGIRTDKSNLTVNDLFNIWLSIKKGLKDNTFANYVFMYKQFVEQELGKMKIADLKRTDVRAFYNKLVDVHGIKVSTVDNIHTVLHQVLDVAVEDDYLRYNPSDNALKELKKAHANDIEKRHALTVAQQELFEEFLSNSKKYHKWYPVFTVLLWTGLRVGEITGLRWSDIDLDNNTISINHTLVYYSRGKNQGCSFAINTPKTKAGVRTVPMLPKVKEAFLMEREFQEECGIMCKATIDGYSDFIFINRFGDTQHQGTLNKALRRIIRDCNYAVLDNNSNSEDVVLLPNFSNHSLRHTFTTRMCEAGVNIKAMQEILGHADIETTMNIYAEATQELKASEISKLQDLF